MVMAGSELAAAEMAEAAAGNVVDAAGMVSRIVVSAMTTSSPLSVDTLTLDISLGTALDCPAAGCRLLSALGTPMSSFCSSEPM